jgi:SAM-dependent methyltransferase
MTPELLKYLSEPLTKAPLELVDAIYDKDGSIVSGRLVSASGSSYPIINGIPRFLGDLPTATVTSFGDEWNYFNYTDFKQNWLIHTVANTFGSPEAFNGRLIVDAGGGSGAQTKWFAEYGAKHVIMLELSHSVDEVVKSNLLGLANVDVIQCSIDAPPLRDRCIDGIVYCHNVIQHTPSVERTAHALYSLVAPGGEFVFNCYGVNDGPGMLRWLRFHVIGRGLFAATRRMTDRQVMAFSYAMAWLRMIPFVGWFLEQSGVIRCGDVPVIAGESTLARLKRRFKQTYLNTRDQHGRHHFQHGKTNSELQRLLEELQPDSKKIFNADRYFTRPPPIGIAFRVWR